MLAAAFKFKSVEKSLETKASFAEYIVVSNQVTVKNTWPYY